MNSTNFWVTYLLIPGAVALLAFDTMSKNQLNQKLKLMVEAQEMLYTLTHCCPNDDRFLQVNCYKNEKIK